MVRVDADVEALFDEIALGFGEWEVGVSVAPRVRWTIERDRQWARWRSL